MNNQCQIAYHNQKKLITVCFDTKCQANRVCCQMCQVEFHKDHIEQLVELDTLMQFIKTQGQKQDVVSPNVAYVIEKLINVQKNVEILMKFIAQEIKRLSSVNLQQYCRNIGNQYNFQTEKLKNHQKWNQLAKDMLSYVELINGQLIENSSNVEVNEEPNQLFMEQFSQYMIKINNEFQNIQQIIDPNSFMQLTVPHILEGHTWTVTGIDICETRNLLVSASVDSTVKLWDLQNFQLLETLKDTDNVFDVVFSSNGNLIAYGGSSKIISLIDISDLNKQNTVSQLKGHQDWISKLVFSQNSMYLITCSYDKTVRIWDVKIKSELFRYNLESLARCVTINNDQTLIASNLKNGNIKVWSFKYQKLLVTQKNIIEGTGIEFSNDRYTLVSCRVDGVIKMWSLTILGQGKLLLIKQLRVSDNEIYSILVTNDSKFIISHCNFEQQVKVMDSLTGKIIKQFEVQGYNHYGDAAITRKADILAYSDGKQIKVWKRN